MRSDGKFTEMLIWVMEIKAFHNHEEIFEPDFLHPESEKYFQLSVRSFINQVDAFRRGKSETTDEHAGNRKRINLMHQICIIYGRVCTSTKKQKLKTPPEDTATPGTIFYSSTSSNSSRHLYITKSAQQKVGRK